MVQYLTQTAVDFKVVGAYEYVTQFGKTRIIAQKSKLELLPLLDSLFFNEQNGRSSVAIGRSVAKLWR